MDLHLRHNFFSRITAVSNISLNITDYSELVSFPLLNKSVFFGYFVIAIYCIFTKSYTQSIYVRTVNSALHEHIYSEYLDPNNQR